jgi:CBS-domain-containing membrane protein
MKFSDCSKGGLRMVDSPQPESRKRRPILTHFVDPKLKKSFKNYLMQSLLATGTCCVMLISLDILIPGALVASLGASTFIVFVGPDRSAARPRGLLGGQLIGTGVGVGCWYLLSTGMLASTVTHRFEVAIFGSLAVGLAIFLMVIIDMEHPPAAGTALALVMSQWSVYSIAFIGGASLYLALVRSILGRRLKDLY